MLYFADTADLNEIKELIDYFPLAGITTNPSILKKSGMKLSSVFSEISPLAGQKMLHIQLISDVAGNMVKEALKYRAILNDSQHLYIKIPVTPEGYKAMRLLKELDFQITATTVFTQQQAMIAARAGADFVAPYVNRLEKYNSLGIQLISNLAKSLKDFNLETKILAASFESIEQVQHASMAGAHAVTLNYQLFKKIIHHPLTDKAVEQFREDGRLMYDIPFEKIRRND